MDALKVSKDTPNLIYIESVKSEKSKEYSPIYVYDLTIPIEGMLRRGAQEFHFYHYKCNAVNSWVDDNSAECVTYDNSSEKCGHEGRAFLWLFGQVSNGNRYDVKVEQSWYRFFNDLKLEVPYYHSAFPFVFNGDEINAEELGNILYGFAGNAGGYSCVELAEGGSWYSYLTTGEFDDEIDSEKVTQGYSLYDEVKKDYFYLHITG